MNFREWAQVVLGEEAGDKLADDYANALGRELDRATFYGTETPDVTKYEDLKCPRCQSDTCPGKFDPPACTTDHAEDHMNAPGIVVPWEFEGTEAEAIGLAVAGAVAAIAQERSHFKRRATLATVALSDLVDVFPETSWASSNTALEKARAALQELKDEEPEPST